MNPKTETRATIIIMTIIMVLLFNSECNSQTVDDCGIIYIGKNEIVETNSITINGSMYMDENSRLTVKTLKGKGIIYCGEKVDEAIIDGVLIRGTIYRKYSQIFTNRMPYIDYKSKSKGIIIHGLINTNK